MTLFPTIVTAMALATGCILSASTVMAQNNGDQILDGIGETSLIARYPLDGSPEDKSRNGFTAKILGTEVKFEENRRGGRVLALPGDKASGLQLPGATLTHIESLSVVGWVRVRSDAPGQTFFEIGKKDGGRFVCTLTGANAAEGLRVGFVNAAGVSEPLVTAASVAQDRWANVAVVVDAAKRTASVYVDGARLGDAKPMKAGLDSVLDATKPEANVVQVGVGLNGLVRDVRLYSVPLTDAQVATIYKNGTTGRRPPQQEQKVAVATTWPAVIDFGGPKIVAVPDIAVSTERGQLPKLPVMVAATYENGVSGPEVRVIWPSPRDAQSVAEAGEQTIVGRVPGTTFTIKAVVKITAPTEEVAPKRVLQSFGLGQVTLDKDAAGRDTPFMKNRDKFVSSLVETNPDDFLYMFRDAFGQPQPQGAKPLGVWDSQTTRLRGHATGHYLSALAQAYASSAYDESLRSRFQTKMNYTIDTLYDLAGKSGVAKEPNGPAITDPTKVPPGPGRTGFDSNLATGQLRTDYWNWGRGFISAYPPDQFIMLEQGATYGTGNNQIWAPYYTLHKIIAGLLDCYEVGGNKKALDVASGMGLWCYERLKVLPAETRIKMWNRYIAGEYGGMNEVMARLNRLTGDPRFLETAKLFDNTDFFYGGTSHAAGLARNVDTLRGKHANQHIPQIIGAIETYGDTGDPVYFRIARNFWDITTNSYTYSIGGVAGAKNPNNAECFIAEPDTIALNGFSEGGQNETCATYNMLKLSRALFMFQPQATQYMDYYERAMLNDILASVAEHNPGNTYHIPLNPGARKSFGNAEMDGFTCCNGTALESNTKLQDSIYFRGIDDASLYVNLFVPSTLKWSEKKLSIKQETSFPYADTTRLTVTGDGKLDVKVRVPGWATKGFFAKVNGIDKPLDAKPGTYVSVGSDWKTGDVIELRMPFDFHLSRVADRPGLASILYGPVVLAAEESAPLTDWRAVKLDAAAPAKSITGDPSTLQFKLGNLNLKPFFAAYDRYSVYFNIQP